MATPEEISEEQKKIRRLRTIVDLTAAMLYQGNLTTAEALELVAATKKVSLVFFQTKKRLLTLSINHDLSALLKNG